MLLSRARFSLDPVRRTRPRPSHAHKEFIGRRPRTLYGFFEARRLERRSIAGLGSGDESQTKMVRASLPSKSASFLTHHLPPKRGRGGETGYTARSTKPSWIPLSTPPTSPFLGRPAPNTRFARDRRHVTDALRIRRSQLLALDPSRRLLVTDTTL